MNALWALIKNTFRETIRDRILYLIAFFALIFIVSSRLMAELSAGEDDRILVNFGLAMIHGFGILITLFIGTQMIAKEMEGKTIMILLSKPISRTAFILAKFFGLSAVLFLLVSLMGGVFCVIAGFEVSYLLIFVGIYLSFLLLLAVALFFSSFISPLLAMFATLLVFILGHITDDFFLYVDYKQGQISEVFYSIGWGSYHLLPNFSHIDFKNNVLYGIQKTVPEVLMSFGITVLYIVFLLVLAVLIFRKKEF